MQNGYHIPDPTQPQQPPRSISAETEIRHLPFDDIKKLGNILQENNQWKELMCSIPGPKEGGKRFDKSDVDILDDAMHKDTHHTGFELLIDNWGTMEEWGRADGGRSHRPQVKDLKFLCLQINNYIAASYINHDILGGEVLQPPGPRFPSPVPSGCSQASLSIEELNAFDNIIESTIESPDESSKFSVPCMKYIYLCHITNSFAKKIGKGSFSEVFEGVTRSKEIPLAIKRLHSADDETKKLVNFEVDQLLRLKHRNILDLYGYSNDSTANPCLVYPFMKNGTLRDMLNYDAQHSMHLNSIQRLEISKGIAEGICHIHGVRTDPKTCLIHRDIKPSNILLDDKMTPKIADFGLLRHAASGDDTQSTPTQVYKGTQPYSPPEAFFNDVSAKWDVWSFGVVLLEILTSLPVIDKTREESHIHCHTKYYVEDNGQIQDLFDSCWNKDNMVGLADSIYDLANRRCLESNKRSRATSEEIVKEFRTLYELSSNV